MRRITQKHDLAIGPVENGIAITEDPELPVLAMLDDFPGAGMHMRKTP